MNENDHIIFHNDLSDKKSAALCGLLLKTMKKTITIMIWVAFLATHLTQAQDEASSFKKPGADFKLFKPSLKVFFDTGNDDPGEIDVFNDGSLSVSLEMVNFVYRYDTELVFNNAPDSTKLWIGPSIGVGITSPADDSEDGSEKASDSPVLMLSAGGFLEYDFSKQTSFLLEAGYALGITSDEGFDDITDGAIYVGLTFDFSF